MTGQKHQLVQANLHFYRLYFSNATMYLQQQTSAGNFIPPRARNELQILSDRVSDFANEILHSFRKQQGVAIRIESLHLLVQAIEYGSLYGTKHPRADSHDHLRQYRTLRQVMAAARDHPVLLYRCQAVSHEILKMLLGSGHRPARIAHLLEDLVETKLELPPYHLLQPLVASVAPETEALPSPSLHVISDDLRERFSVAQLREATNTAELQEALSFALRTKVAPQGQDILAALIHALASPEIKVQSMEMVHRVKFAVDLFLAYVRNGGEADGVL